MTRHQNSQPGALDGFVSRRLAVNSVMGGIRFAVTAGVYLAIYPFMLRSLGSARFGLWALLCLPGQYIALGDLGISSALIKLVSEDHPHRNTLRLLQLTGAGVFLFSVVGGVIAGVAFWERNGILSWLRIQPTFLPEARVLLVGMAAVIWLTLLANIYVALLSGLHRMDLAHTVQMCNAVLNGAGILFALRLRTGLIGLLLSSAFAALMTWILAVFLAKRIAHVEWIVVPRIRWRATKSLLNFGMYMYAAALSALLLEPSIKTLLSRYGSLEMVSFFEIASRAVIQARSFFSNIMLPLLPASSLLMTDAVRIRELAARSMRLLWLTAIPVFVTLSVLAAPIIHVWLGRSIPLAQGALSVLAVGWLLNVLTLPAYFLVQGMNHPRWAMWCALMQGMVCIGGSYLLIPRLGFYGAIGSEAAGLSIGAAYISWRFLSVCPLRTQQVFSNSSARAFFLPVFLGMMLWLVSRSPAAEVPWVWLSTTVGICALYAALLYRRVTNGFTAIELLKGYLP
jgi:O-antigen/teichoic acid export membrane protein